MFGPLGRRSSAKGSGTLTRARVAAEAGGAGRADGWDYAEAAPHTQIVLPRSRGGTTVNLIWGERPDLPDLKPRRVGGPLAFALKALAAATVIAAGYWGPSYYSCRGMKERGMFYYGTTIGSCMSEQIDARTASFETLARKLVPAL